MTNENQNEDISLDEVLSLLQKLKNEAGISEDEIDSELLKLFETDSEKLDEEFYSYFNTKEIKVKKLHPDAVLPKYNYTGDSGFDLYSVENFTLPSLGRALIPTGLSFQFEEGYEIQVRTKSGLAINQGIMVLNSPGTVDQNYSGEIKVPIFNTNLHPVEITKGMKVAQGVLCPVIQGKYVEIVEVNSINETDRGDRGFGSTGIQI